MPKRPTTVADILRLASDPKVREKVKEFVTSKRYSGKKYTFEEAYKDARSNGQKTFLWDGKYYNTDYEGVHGKQYKKDIASGKAAAWEKEYPNFTNPELRKEKQEELDTYGITNEQTKNKTIKDRTLRKIPARGYDVNDAISAMRGEHHSFSQYNSVEDLISALRKKYPKLKDVPLTGGYVDTVDGGKAIYLDSVRDLKKPDKVDDDMWQAFINDVYNYDRFNVMAGNPAEIHRPELDYLLGYPTSINELVKNIAGGLSNTPMISSYKTGSLPYYYTTPLIEASRPFIPEKFLSIGRERREKEKEIEELNSRLVHPNMKSLPEGSSYADYLAADEKDMSLPENKDIYRVISDYYDTKFGPFDEFTEKMYDENNPEYAERWNNLGVNMIRGGLDIDYQQLARSSVTPAEIDTLGGMGAFDYLEPLELMPGNHLAGSGNEAYYRADEDYDFYKGKYSKLIDKINPSKEDHNRYSGSGINTEGYIYSDPSLGTYTLGVPKDTSFVSVWDKFDIDPFGSGNDKPIIQVGKPFEYYTRFYPEGKTPDIDKLYKEFNSFDMGGNKDKKERKRIDSVTKKILQQDAARQRYESGRPQELPLQSEDWKFALGMAGLSGLSKAIPAVGAELAAFGPLYKQAAKTLLTDIPAFETIDRLPTLWERGRLTQEVGSGVERGVRAVLPDGKVEDIVAPALGTVAGFAAGIPVGGVSHLMARNAGNVLNATADAANRIMQDNAVRKATSSMLPVDDVYGYGNGAVSSLVDAPAEQAATPLYQAYRESIGMPERFANPWVGFRSPSYQYAEPTFNYIERMTPMQMEGVNLGLNPGDPGYVDLDLNRIAAGVNMRRTARRNVEDYIQRLSQARWPRDVSAADRARNLQYNRFLNFNLPETSRNYRPQTMVQDWSGNYFPEDSGVVAARREAVARTGRRQDAVRRSYREMAEEDLRLLQRDLADYRQRAGNEIANTGAVSSDTDDAIRNIQGEIANAERRVAANAPTRRASIPPVVSGELATEADIDAFLAEEARNQALDDAIRQDVAEQAYEFTDSAPSANGLLSPVRELSDAEFISRATPRQLRLLSSTPSRAEQTRIVNNVMSDVFGSDWRTNPNAFTESSPRLGPTGQIPGVSRTGNVFADRYGIMPDEFERLVGSAPNGRRRDLHELMQTARNLETEAGGLENLRTMLAEGRLPGGEVAVRTPSPSPAPTVSTPTPSVGGQLAGVGPQHRIVYDIEYGRTPEEIAEMVRATGRNVNSISDLSSALREIENEFGSREVLLEGVRRGSLSPTASGNSIRASLGSSGYNTPTLMMRGNTPFNPVEIADLNDEELTRAYFARMSKYIKGKESNGIYRRDYGDAIERDAVFREIAKEMQKRFGEGRDFNFGNLAGTEYDKMALWMRSPDSPYSKAGAQYILPGDIRSQLWEADATGMLNGSSITPAEAARRLHQSVPRGSALATTYPYGSTSIDSNSLPIHMALENYGIGPGQSSVVPFFTDSGAIHMSGRNSMGFMSNWSKQQLLDDFATAGRDARFSSVPIDFNDQMQAVDFESFLNGDPGVGSDKAKLFRDFVKERLSKRRNNILLKLDRPWAKVSAKEGWAPDYIPKARISTDIDKEVRDILGEFASGASRVSLETPESASYITIKHNLGGPLLLNPYAGGGPLGNGFPDFMTRNDATRSYNTGVKAKGLKDRALRKELKEWESGPGAQLIRDSSLVKYINPRDLSISYIPEDIVPKEDNASKYGHGPAHIDAFTGLDKDSDEFISRLIYVGVDGETGGYIYLDPLTGEQELYDSYLEGAQDEGDLGLYAKGGKIHIKPSHRGRFTALLKRTGKSASWFKAHGTPSQKKMATFALNARKWKHADGGPLNNGIDYSGIETTNNRKYNPDYISYIDSALANAELPDAKRASILANIIEESGGDPFALDSTGKFYGLLQWTNDRYSPTGELDPYREIDNQVANIVSTLGNTTDGMSWTHGGTGSGYNSYKDAMADFDNEDLATAMKGFTLGYVRPSGKIDSYNNRLRVAQQILDKYNNVPEKKAATLIEKMKAAFGNDTEAMLRLVNAAKASGGFR